MRILTDQRIFGLPVAFDTDLQSHVLALVNPQTGAVAYVTAQDAARAFNGFDPRDAPTPTEPRADPHTET